MRRLLLLALLAYPVGASAAAPECRMFLQPRAVPELVTHLSESLNGVPQPLPRIHTEGTLPHEGIYDESVDAKRQLPLMRDAALAWRMGAGEAHLAMAIRYLNAWVAVYQPSFNPIDETDFDALIETYSIVAPSLEPAAKTAADLFLRRWASGYVAVIDSHRADIESPKVNNWNNNWQSHRIKLLTMMAVAIDDPALFGDARRIFRAQIEVNIRPDGKVSDFEVRDALHYVVYDLEPLTMAALAARRRGEDWFNYQAPSGGSISKAFVWLKPYAAGERGHDEFVNSTIAFDARRAAAGVKGFSGPFDPAKAGKTYWLGSVFEPSYAALAQRLAPNPPSSLMLCDA